MNTKIKEIKDKIRVIDAKLGLSQPKPLSTKDMVTRDELRLVELMKPYGTDWFPTHLRNKFERWDCEGKHNDMEQDVKIELKSRPNANTFDSWIIDSYKIDYLLKEFPHDIVYFVNACQGEFHLYDAQYVSLCPTTTKMANFDGHRELRTFYEIPKSEFIIELETKTKGGGFHPDNTIFK